MVWNQSDLDWLNEYYPGLKLVNEKSIAGVLSFRMLHQEGQSFVDPSDAEVQAARSGDHTYIEDEYRLRIAWLEDVRYPVVFETGGRLAAVAKRLGKNLVDMHQFDSSSGARARSLCLAATMELERTFQGGFKLPVLIDQFVVPYCFAQSFFAKNGRWPWGDLAHGVLGLLQWLGREPSPTFNDVRSTYQEVMRINGLEAQLLFDGKYPGGSERKFRVHHPDAHGAVMMIRTALSIGTLAPGQRLTRV